MHTNQEAPYTNLTLTKDINHIIRTVEDEDSGENNFSFTGLKFQIGQTRKLSNEETQKGILKLMICNGNVELHVVRYLKYHFPISACLSTCQVQSCLCPLKKLWKLEKVVRIGSKLEKTEGRVPVFVLTGLFEIFCYDFLS